jgi:protein involved in polysaccharide export with SLBB domain
MRKRFWIPLLIALLASGRGLAQTSPPSNSPPTSISAPTNATVLPSNLAGYVPDDKYKLRVGDKIAFQIIEDRDPARLLTIADSGEVDIPWIGRVAAVDKSCKQLADDCKAELEKEYYHRATVIIALETANRFLGRVSVWGCVKNQGAIDISVNENLKASQAILRAGGFGDFANRKAVKLVREVSPGLAAKTIIINMVEIIDKGKTEKDVVLQPGDTIFVPTSFVNF